MRGTSGGRTREGWKREIRRLAPIVIVRKILACELRPIDSGHRVAEEALVRAIPTWLVTVLIGISASEAQAQAGVVAGTVADSATGAPVEGAQVRLVRPDGDVVAATRTDAAGRYRLAGVEAGRYELDITRIGYVPRLVGDVRVAPGAVTTVHVRLDEAALPMAPIVASASRSPEATFDAPASVSVVSREQIAEAAQFTPVDRVRTEPGVDFSSKGLVQHTFAVRGDRSGTSGAMLMLTDYRYAGIPSLAFNIPYLVPLAPSDIERIEVMRGPGAALYGPNTHRGVLHILTRSPFDDPGASLTLTAGERSVVQGTGRLATRLGDRVAVKVSGDYFRGNDWEYVDPEEVVSRDNVIERGAAEGRIDWRPGGGTSVSAAVGWAQAFNLVDVPTAVGGVQVRNWRYQYVQSRVARGRLSVNAMYNWSDAGSSRLLRSDTLLVDRSRAIAGQVQHGTDLGAGVELLYGVDARYTEPRTGGTIHGRYEDDDEVAEIGGYLHGRWSAAPTVDVVAAARLDYHDRLGDVVLSPRIGVVWKPAPTHALRLTYNRAFNSPDPGDLFADVIVRTLRPDLPYDARLLGVPRDGLHYRQGGALCMRTPFATGAQGGASACLPPDVTVLWDTLVAIAAGFGVDLSSVPPPDNTQVATAFFRIVDENTVVSADTAVLGIVAPDRRTITSAVEVGYKGLVGQSVFVTLDVYHTWIKDAFGTPTIGTPSAAFEGESLAAYLDDFMPPEDAQAIAGVVSQIPAGTVTPWEAGSPDLLVFEPQGGTVRLWGADLSVSADLSESLSVQGSYSWVSDDSVANVTVVGDYVVNGPRNKGAAAATYRHERSGVRVGVGGRYVSSFPVVAGVYAGRVDEYGVLDLRAGWALPGMRNVELSVEALNVLDNRHQEFVGAAEIGRLVLARVRATF